MDGQISVAWFDAEEWEKDYLSNKDHSLNIDFYEDSLNSDTAEKAEGYDTVAVFVSSQVNSEVLEKLDIDLVVCRSTGYDHIDLEKAEQEGITVCNVPEYGACTVAEHTFGLMLALSRKIYDAIERVEEGKFDHQGLRGFDLKNKKLGVVGTGSIGQEVIKRAKGFEMDVIAFDPYPKDGLEEELGFMYVSLDDLIEQSDIISLHCPLTDENRYMLSEDEFNKMDSTLVINTARGELIDTEALIRALKSGNVRAAGLDVLEEECYIQEDIEVEELSEECDLQVVLEDHILIERDDVLITPHNAFNSVEAMQRIVDTTLDNLESQANTVTH